MKKSESVSLKPEHVLVVTYGGQRSEVRLPVQHLKKTKKHNRAARVISFFNNSFPVQDVASLFSFFAAVFLFY